MREEMEWREEKVRKQRRSEWEEEYERKMKAMKDSKRRKKWEKIKIKGEEKKSRR